MNVYQNSSDFTSKNLSVVSNKLAKKSDQDVTMKDSSCKDSKNNEIHQPAILKSSCGSKKISDHTMEEYAGKVKPFSINTSDKESALM